MDEIKRRVTEIERREERDREEISALARAVTEISSGMAAIRELIPEWRSHMRQQREMSSRQDERLKALSQDVRETRDEVASHGQRLDDAENQMAEWKTPLKILIAIITAASLGALGLEVADQSGYMDDKTPEQQIEASENPQPKE
jgi:chromosome segregation ATPase